MKVLTRSLPPFLALGLFACKPVPADNSGKPRVAMVMKSLANEFFSTMAEGAKKHQATHATDYELMVRGSRTKPTSR